MSDDVAACEWASTIGDGLHVDMANAGGPWIATCCDVGEIDGPEGRVVQPCVKLGHFRDFTGTCIYCEETL